MALPCQDSLVRWPVNEVLNWLERVNLGDFKDQFRKEGIDGTKLAKLSDSDIDRFSVKAKRKKEDLKKYIRNIDRSTTKNKAVTLGRPAPHPPRQPSPAPPPRPPRAIPSTAPPPVPVEDPPDDFDDDNEDAYSWGDEFEEHSSGDDDDYINEDQSNQFHSSVNGHSHQPQHEADHHTGPNIVQDDDFYEDPNNPSQPQPAGGGGILESLQAALHKHHLSKRQTTNPALDHKQVESDEDDDYVEPSAGPDSNAPPPRPPQRPPQNTPSYTNQVPLPPAGTHRPVPRPEMPTQPKNLPGHRRPPPEPKEEDEEVYDIPIEEQVSPRSRRLPPVPTFQSDRKISTDSGSQSKAAPHSGRNVPNASQGGSLPKCTVTAPKPAETFDDTNQDTYEIMDQAPSKPAPKKMPREPEPRKPTQGPQHNTRRRQGPLPAPPQVASDNTGRSNPTGRNVPRDTNAGNLDKFDWYHKDASRTHAEQKLRNENVDGMFLIRNSTRPGQMYTLMIHNCSQIYNLPIRQRSDQKFALGAPKNGELAFNSVLEMVDYFKNRKINLNPQVRDRAGQAKLTEPLPKESRR